MALQYIDRDVGGYWYDDGVPAASTGGFDYTKLFGAGFEWMAPYAQQYLSGVDTQAEYDFAKSVPFENRYTSTPYEALSYYGAAVSSPEIMAIVEKRDRGEQLTPEEQYVIGTTYGLQGAGQNLTRIGTPVTALGDPTSGDNPQGAQQLFEQTAQTAGVDPASITFDDRNSAWAAENTAAKQAARDDDGGFGSILGIAVGVALAAFGVPAIIATSLGVPTAVGSAITGGLTSLITGGNPLVGAATGFLGGSFGGAEGAGAEYLAAADAAGGLVPEFGTSAAYDAATGAVTPSSVAGDFVNPQDMLASAGVSDVPQGLQGEVSGPETTGAFDQYGSLATPSDAFGTQTVFDAPRPGIVSGMMDAGATGAFDQGQFTPQDVGLTPASQADKPFGKMISDFWKELSPGQATVLTGVAGLGFGALKGIGDRENAVELQKMKNAAALEQIGATADAGVKAKEDYLNYLRSLPGWKGRIKLSAPAQQRPLRRPDGSMVYGPGGLIVGNMGG